MLNKFIEQQVAVILEEKYGALFKRTHNIEFKLILSG